MSEFEIEIVRERAFTGPVGRRPVRAAHGNVMRVEQDGAGRRRHVNINGMHREEGPWGPTHREREEMERAARKRREIDDAQAALDDARALLAAANIRLLRVERRRGLGSPTLVVNCNGETRRLARSLIERAATPQVVLKHGVPVQGEGDRTSKVYAALLRVADAVPQEDCC